MTGRRPRLLDMTDISRRNRQMNPTEYPIWHIVGRKPGILDGLLVLFLVIMDKRQSAIRISQKRIDRVQSYGTLEMLDGKVEVGRPCVHPATSYQNVERIGVGMSRLSYRSQRNVVFSGEPGNGMRGKRDCLGLVTAGYEGLASKTRRFFPVPWSIPALTYP
jgi:hypothetical protein